MKKIFNPGRGALVLAMACMAFACAKPGATTNQANAAAANPANAATANAANAATVNTAAPVASPAQNPEDKIPRIRVEEARKLVADGKAVIIDVRGTEVYKMSHIKGSLDVPLPKLEAHDFKGIPKDKIIIAYCG